MSFKEKILLIMSSSYAFVYYGAHAGDKENVHSFA